MPSHHPWPSSLGVRSGPRGHSLRDPSASPFTPTPTPSRFWSPAPFLLAAPVGPSSPWAPLPSPAAQEPSGPPSDGPSLRLRAGRGPLPPPPRQSRRPLLQDGGGGSGGSAAELGWNHPLGVPSACTLGDAAVEVQARAESGPTYIVLWGEERQNLSLSVLSSHGHLFLSHAPCWFPALSVSHFHGFIYLPPSGGPVQQPPGSSCVPRTQRALNKYLFVELTTLN